MKHSTEILLVALLSLVAGCALFGGGGSRPAPAPAPVERPQDAPERSADAEGEYRSGVESMSGGNYAAAIVSLRRATGLKPDYTEAWAALGSSYMKLKDYQNGVAAYRRALELAPDDGGYLRAVAYGYLCLNNLNLAEEFYLKVVERDSLSYDGNEELGFIYQKKDDLDYAIKYYRAALRIWPDDAATMETLAGLYEKKGNQERAYEYLQRAADAAPGNEDYRARLGLAYMKDKVYVDAVPVFEGLGKDHPDNADYHLNLGLALSQTADRKADAAAELERTLTLKGDDPHVCAVLARLYNDLKQYDKTIETAQRGLAAGGGEEAILNYEMGTALSKLGRYDEAISAFRKTAESKDPAWTDAAKKQISRQEALKKRGETTTRGE